MVESVAIVTGASSGIGRASALRLCRDFSGVVLIGRDGEKLRQLVSHMENGHCKALALELDLTRPVAAATAIETTLNVFGRIDALLNIAGAVPGLDVFQMSDEQWESAMALKLHAARRLTLHAWDWLKSSKGSVVFTSGNAAVIPRAAAAAVGTINAATEALAKAFADRGLEDGVQVNSISPGAVLTGRRLAMLEKFAADRNVGLEEAKQLFLRQAGIGRFGSPEDIAELMAFVVSPAARWMTGSVLRMDGGEVKSV